MRRPTGRRLAAGVRPGPVTLAAVLLVAGCADATIRSGDSDVPYEQALAEICLGTEAELAELPEPPEAISVADFATEVARILAAEADGARRLDPPDDLADDHRAFVANTDEQAAGWTVVAGSDTDALGDETTRIAGLTLGRDDLAAEMGVAECRRDT